MFVCIILCVWKDENEKFCETNSFKMYHISFYIIDTTITCFWYLFFISIHYQQWSCMWILFFFIFHVIKQGENIFVSIQHHLWNYLSFFFLKNCKRMSDLLLLLVIVQTIRQNKHYGSSYIYFFLFDDDFVFFYVCVWVHMLSMSDAVSSFDFIQQQQQQQQGKAKQ